MGDSPDPRDDAGSSDAEDAEESEPTEPAPESDASGDDTDESQDHESEEADEPDAENASGDTDPDAEDASDASDTEGASADTDGDAADAPDEGDTDAEGGDSDELPEHLQPSDESDSPDEDTGESAEPFDREVGDSFGTPPESSFESSEDWAEAMNAGDDAEAEDADITPEDALEVADSDSVVSESSADDFEGIGEADPAVAEPVEAGNLEGPATDEEMPLAVHIEEMVRRVAIVLGVAGVVTLIAYPLSERLIEFLWQSYVPQPDVNRPHVYGPLEFVLTKLKVAGLSGTIVGLPVFVYETYRFMKPGLYPNERRYYLASVPTSLVLAFVGVAFSHFVILPLTVLYFTSYTENAAIVAFGLRETFNLIILMMGYMAIIFQIPLFIMLAIMMGLVTREWMEDKRLLFWGGFGGLAFTFVTVDPTGMAPIIIAVTMIVLFEGTLALLRWTGH